MNKFLIRGLGFFNDAYDLFVMNIVNVVLTELYGKHVYTQYLKSAVSAASLLGAVIGQLVFGILGDLCGRRVNMIATCLLLIAGGILCTAAYGGSPEGTLWFLVVARGLLGIGIGGEYPLAASSTAEDADSVRDRNRRVALTFSLQGVGALVAAVLGNLLVEALASQPKGMNKSSHLELVWRLLFGIGVLPASVVCYYRIFASDETKVFREAQERMMEVDGFGGFHGFAEMNESQEDPQQSPQPPPVKQYHKRARFSFIWKFYRRQLVGCAGTWFLFDIVFYAQNLFAASILSVIGVENEPSLRVITTQNAFMALTALPGYYVAVCFINKLGRKRMQMQGFAFMTILFIILATQWHTIQHHAVSFILLYGLTLFFANFGPNTTTFVLPTEMFPTAIRSTCHGFSAAMGKAGAAIGSFGFSIWVENPSFGYVGAFYTFAALTLLSMPLTWWCTFDNNEGLDALDQEFEQRLYLADHVTRESFASLQQEQSMRRSASHYEATELNYEAVTTPPAIEMPPQTIDRRRSASL